MHAFALLALVAAYNTNNPNVYQLVAFAGGCNGCHFQAGVSAPTITATQVTPDPLTAGGSAQFSIQVKSNRTDPSTFFAAFAAGVPGNPGTITPDAPALACGQGAEPACPNGVVAVRDVSKEHWGTDGTFTWTFTIANLKAGSYTMNIGANDIDGNGFSTGDHNAPGSLQFVVAEGEGEGEGEGAAGGEGEGAAGGEGEGAGGEGEGEGEGEGGAKPPGGCSAASTSTSVPFAALAIIGVAAVRFGRRATRRT